MTERLFSGERIRDGITTSQRIKDISGQGEHGCQTWQQVVEVQKKGQKLIEVSKISSVFESIILAEGKFRTTYKCTDFDGSTQYLDSRNNDVIPPKMPKKQKGLPNLLSSRNIKEESSQTQGLDQLILF